MYNFLINKLMIIKNKHPEYYKESCINNNNLLQDLNKRMFAIYKIIFDYERLYSEEVKNKTNDYVFLNSTSNSKLDIFNLINNFKKTEDFNNRNLNTTTKSTPLVNAGSLNSFEDLAINYYNKIDLNNDKNIDIIDNNINEYDKQNNSKNIFF